MVYICALTVSIALLAVEHPSSSLISITMKTSTLFSAAGLALTAYATPVERALSPWNDAPQGERVMTRLDKAECVLSQNRPSFTSLMT
jgi:hypothetical protein